MKIRDSVFDSRAEKGLFQELDSRLNPKLRLRTQMGLRSLIHLDDTTVARLKPSHHRYFRQATVDFTFIYPDGRPLLSIEFDGIGGGYSRGRTYVGRRKTSDQRRDWKMGFKLAAAARVGHPLFVISGDEIEHLDTDFSLMLVDGIVGQIFSRWEEQRIAGELLDDDAELIASMSPGAAQEHAQDLVLQAGVIADLEFDHLAIAVAQEQQRCQEQFGFGFGGYKLAWLYDPPNPDYGRCDDAGSLAAPHRGDASCRSGR